MSNRYPHLNSPLRVRNSVFQNRLIVGPGIPIFSQASETYPCDGWLAYEAKACRGGVGAVTCQGANAEIHNTEEENGEQEQMGHQPNIQIMRPISNQHRFAETAEIVKASGAIPACQCMPPMTLTVGWDVSTGIPSEYVEGDGSKPVLGKEAPVELIRKVIEAFGDNAALMKTLGYQMVQLHFAYRNMFGGRFLSRVTNKRTDEYGGSVENRARFAVEVAQEIKRRCGKDFLVHIAITAEEPHEIYGEDGLTMAETLEFLKYVNGSVDIISLREHQIDFAVGPGYRNVDLPNRPAYHQLAECIRENGYNIRLAYVCGAHDLDECEDLIASGDADFILTTRGFISNPDLAVKLHEGRGDDVVPCLRCNRCHHDRDGVWASVCAVNPTFALEMRERDMVCPTGKPKNIAVIGGGCAGMKFAMDAYDLGHRITIYEKTESLGGQLNLAGVPYVKSFVKKFRNYLVHQIEKREIEVVLNHEVQPGELAGKYDRVIFALGAVPLVPKIPGIEMTMPFPQALRNSETVKGDVIVIGGGEVGLETSLHLEKLGHKVRCIDMHDKLAPEMPPVHYRRAYREMWESLENFSWSLNSTVTGVYEKDGRIEVRWTCAGEEHSALCDTAILAAGTRGLFDEAVTLAGSMDTDYRMIGDCRAAGNIANAMRTAYYAARNM